jgi:hypothetical protein
MFLISILEKYIGILRIRLELNQVGIKVHSLLSGGIAIL